MAVKITINKEKINAAFKNPKELLISHQILVWFGENIDKVNSIITVFVVDVDVDSKRNQVRYFDGAGTEWIDEEQIIDILDHICVI